MIWSAFVACLWVPAATITAFLPMRLQMVPGIGLLIAAPALIVWLGADFGWLIAAVGVFAFVSMFRNPLRYFWARARGQNPQLPPEMTR
ncbi:DUF2484 family protein [Loktanella salsilacus]|uniref:DUF2484 family protein n=1 Tax=Loktanella salsilacus TaxID=195913 RepID=UPI003734C35B